MKEVLLYADDEPRAREEISRAGGRVTHVLTSSVLVAEVPHDADLQEATTQRPEGLDAMSVSVADAWEAAQSKSASLENIAWDTEGFEPPC
jgi:hypothetical protein